MCKLWKKKRSSSVFGVGLCLGLAGCLGGEGDELPNDGALTGTWTLPERVWIPDIEVLADYLTIEDSTGSPLCDVRLAGSRGTVSCRYGIEGGWGEIDSVQGEYTFEAEYTLEATLRVQEDAVSAEGTWSSRSFSKSSEYGDYARECVMTFSGSATKLESRDTSGRFSALAGAWSGSVTTKGNCQGTDAFDTANLDSAITVQADVQGEQGTARIRALGSAGETTWVFQNGPGGLDVRELGGWTTTTVNEVP
jgi:hypothetical protein